MLNDKVEKINDANSIINYLLQARRQEKNYILRNDRESIAKLNENIDMIVNVASGLEKRFASAGNKQLSRDIIKSANEYKNSFSVMVKNSESQVEAEEKMVAAARLAQEECDKARADQKAKMDSRILLANRLIMGFSLGAIVLGVILAFIISLSITKPVKQTLEMAQSVAIGDLSRKLDIDTKEEIGQFRRGEIPALFSSIYPYSVMAV